MGDRTGVEGRSAYLFGLLLCPGQSLHQAEGVVGRWLAVIAPLENGKVGHVKA